MQAYILSINTKWVAAIKDGSKKYEFRSLQYKNLKVGAKIYICETKRTKHIMTNDKEFDYCYNCAYKTWDISKPIGKYCAPLIVAEFIIKKVWWLHLGVGAWKFDNQDKDCINYFTD